MKTYTVYESGFKAKSIEAISPQDAAILYCRITYPDWYITHGVQLTVFDGQRTVKVTVTAEVSTSYSATTEQA